MGTLWKETLIHGLLSDVLELVCAFPQSAGHAGFHSARFPVGPKEETVSVVLKTPERTIEKIKMGDSQRARKS
jgi:hypothetical protein